MNDLKELYNEVIKIDINSFIKKQDEMYNNIDKKNFFKILENDFGYTVDMLIKIIDGGVYEVNEQQYLNIVFRSLNENYGIKMIDVILFLEDILLTNRIMKFIDEETEWILKKELNDKYKIIKKKNNIHKIIT